jgi:hypothetical protein
MVGDLGKGHMIHVVVNNRQAEHPSTVLKMSGMIIDQTFCILIDPGDTERFIYSEALKIIKVKEVEHDKFKYVEMASGAKTKVGGKVMDCSIKLGDFITKANL